MQQKAFNAQNKGMMRDLSMSKFQNEHAFENFNIRIEARDNETMYSVTNERGQKFDQNIAGRVLGSAYISDCQILFCKDGNTDYIYKCQIIDDKLKVKTLFRGSLGFPSSCIIETVVRYESDKVRKVYWVDGKNITRVINVADERLRTQNEFDFVPQVISSNKVQIQIEKSYVGEGGFPSGTVQYFLTYYNKTMQESRIFYSSALNYNTFQDRGGAPDVTVPVQYTINITDLSKDFEYLRVYSYVKSSSGVGSAYLVGDYKIPASGSVTVIDNGIHNTTIDPTLLLYVGGQDFIASTIVAKDGKLFLGQLKYKEANDTDSIQNILKGCIRENGWESDVIRFDYDEDNPLYLGKQEGQYTYEFQLGKESSKILSFKGEEKYRFALQFTDARGTVTRAYWIGDKINRLYPRYEKDSTSMLRIVALCNLTDQMKKSLQALGYVSYTLLIAKATAADRSVLAQGLVNPTVFNLYDRYKNINFARASWITRPNGGKMANVHYDVIGSADGPYGEIQNACWEDEPTPYLTYEDTSEKTIVGYRWGLKLGRYSKAVFGSLFVNIKYSDGTSLISPDYGGYDGFYVAHDDPGRSKRDNLYKDMLRAWINLGLKETDFISRTEFGNVIETAPRDKNKWIYWPSSMTFTGGWKGYNSVEGVDIRTPIAKINKWRSQYFVDSSVVTLNSPELDQENVPDLSASNIKFRIVGIAPVNANTTSYDINYKSSYLKGTSIYQVNMNNEIDAESPTGFLSYPIYQDGRPKKSEENTDDIYVKADAIESVNTWYSVYLFNKEGSLMGTSDMDNNPVGELERKIIANRRFSSYTGYANSMWSPDFGTSAIKFYDSNNRTSIVLDGAEGSIYEGNVNTLNIDTDYRGTIQNYPIYGSLEPFGINSSKYTEIWKSSDPVKIKYSSTNHAVIAFKNKDNQMVTLPWYVGEDNNPDVAISSNDVWLPWKNEEYKKYYITGNSYDWNTHAGYDSDKLNSYVFIGELYRECLDGIYDTRYGGISESAITQNEFVPASAQTPILQNIIGDRGDTYIQRYDCLKIAPDNETEKQQLVDITSIMVETHINLDGRYDTKRYWNNLLGIDYSNFAPVNKGYTATEDLLINNTLDKKFNDGNYGNQAVHSLTANAMEDVDTWTNVTLAATVDFDGRCGKLNKLMNFNNNIFAFQDKGISVVPYNERTQINNTNGLPIEIANSMTVGTPQYLSKEIGCINKASIVGTASGIYFVDDYNKNIDVIEGQEIKPISILKGFNVWTQKNCNSKIWTSANATGFHSYYDSIYGDIYFYFNDSEGSSLNTLCYNERLGEFTSFFSYGNVEDMFSLKGRVFSIKGGKAYENHKGDFGVIYGEQQGYYSIYNVTPDPFSDKTYSTVEYRANMYRNNEATQNLPYDNIEAWNDYQRGQAKVKLHSINTYPDVRRKFRIWRTDIPRDTLESKYGLNRIRSPWVKIKLSKDPEEVQRQRMELHDMTVTYFE